MQSNIRRDEEGHHNSRAAGAALAAVSEPKAGARAIRVLLGNEPSMFRDSLRALLIAQPDLTVVGHARDAGSMADMVAQYRPDILLFEPENASVVRAVLHGIQQAGVKTRVVLLASGEIEPLTETVRPGVAGIVSKRRPAESLLTAIRKVHAGETWLDQEGVSAPRRTAVRPPAEPRIARSGSPGNLSRREREIVALVAQGFRNREIADKLLISEQTVKNHMHNIFERAGVQDRLELALFAIYHQLYEK